MKPSEMPRRMKSDLETAKAEWETSGIFDESIDLCHRCQGPAILYAWMDSSSMYDPYREVQICFACGKDVQVCECGPQGCRTLGDILNWVNEALRAISLAEAEEAR